MSEFLWILGRSAQVSSQWPSWIGRAEALSLGLRPRENAMLATRSRAPRRRSLSARPSVERVEGRIVLSSPDHLAITGEPPSTVSAGTPFSLTVEIEDSLNAIDSTYNQPITLALASNLPGTSLGGTLTATPVKGVAVFSGLSLTTAGSDTIVVSGPSVASVTSTTITVVPGPVRALAVTGFPANATTGVASSFTVSAIDAYANLVPTYRGTVRFTSTDSHAVLPANYTFQAMDAGQHTFVATLETLGEQRIRARDTASVSVTGLESGIEVFRPAVGFSITGLTSPVVAGTTQTFTVTAIDSTGAAARGYTGPVYFEAGSSSIDQSSYTFTVADAGQHTFSVAFYRAGMASLGATLSNETNRLVPRSGVALTVVAAAPAKVEIGDWTSTNGGTQVAGEKYGLQVVVVDAYGNPAAYTGTVQVSSSDPNTYYYPSSRHTFTAADHGIWAFQEGFVHAGAKTLAVAGTTSGLPGSEIGISVVPAPANHFVVTYPALTTAGVSHMLTATAYDPFGNLAWGYTGTVQFSSTDAHATLPNDYSFLPSDRGVKTFPVALVTAGSRSIGVTDMFNPSIFGWTAGITVVPGAAQSITVAGVPTNVQAGSPERFTVTLLDAYGNLATGYTGTVAFSSDDPAAILPPDFTFTAANAGTATFTARFFTFGMHWLTVADTKKTLYGQIRGINVI
jgi:hypothetical protein